MDSNPTRAHAISSKEGLLRSTNSDVAFHIRQQQEEEEEDVVCDHDPCAQTPCSTFWYRWINPWVRMCVVIPILYVYSIVLSVATHRDIVFQLELANVVPRPALTHPIFDRTTNKAAFILPDIMFDLITPPPFPSDEYSQWKAFIDSSPAFWCSLAFVLFCMQRNIIRVTEYVGMHILLYIIQSLLKAFTNYPAAAGIEPSCFQYEHATLGPWIAHNFSIDYCGDQMFSGHTSETIVAMIIVRRMVWDYLGWGFACTEKQEAKNYRIINKQAHEVRLAHLHINDASYSAGNTCVFFHVRDMNAAPKWVQRNRALVWYVVSAVRCVMWVWLVLLLFALLRNRQHYSADVTAAVLMMTLLTTNRVFLVALVRWLYRPDFWNYRQQGLFCRVYLKEPLTYEQVHYERWLSRIGKGGLA